MIVVDTDVVSESMSRAPSAAVLRWLNERDTDSMFLTTVTIAEISYVLFVLPRGKRRSALESRFERFVREGFERRLLDFDASARFSPPARAREAPSLRRRPCA